MSVTCILFNQGTTILILAIAFVQSAKPNLSVLDEYRRRRGEYNERKKDLDLVTDERDTVKFEVEALRKKRLDEFMSGFNIISQKLKEMYQVKKALRSIKILSVY